MPLFRTDTGCRCRRTLVSITTTRLRRSRGAGWRKMLFQTWELRMKSPTDIEVPDLRLQIEDCRFQSAIQNLQSHFDIRFRIIPLPHFLLKLLALVHDDLAVLVEADAPAFQGAGGRPLEINAAD